ncbi:MAG: NAD-glutamate dehydrogenase [Burkholderiaceae bacterium]
MLSGAKAKAAGTTMVQIVHPDMAFLVDSVSIAVNQSGRTEVHWILHPLLRVSSQRKRRAE